jgi:hypothetical protein
MALIDFLFTNSTSARHRMLHAAACATLASLATFGHTQSRFEEEFDDEEKPWQEIAIQLPAAPAAENLIPFYVSATATQSFSIDGNSLTVGSDGVVRYTMVTKSGAGATNVSYEGIRCESFEKKLYAFGRTDGSWSRSRRDQWEPIMRNAANRQHAALAMEYICQEKIIAGNARDIVERLRQQRSLAPHHSR